MMRYFLDHATDTFVPVPAYLHVESGMMVQRFDGPRDGEIPWPGGQDDDEDARERDQA